MATLFDTLQQNQGLMSQTQPQAGTTYKAADLLRAKSGRATGGSGIASSNLGEQQATTSANQTVQNQVLPATQIQLAGAQQQNQAINQKTNQDIFNTQQGRSFDNQQTAQKATQMLQDLAQNKGKISANQYQSQMEQTAQALRLGTQQYTDKLQQEGETARLNSKIGFTEALQKSIFSGNEDLLKQKLNMSDVLAQSDREFAQKMSQMSLDTAWQLLNTDMASAQERALYTGIGNVAAAGVGAYGKYEDNQAKAGK